MNRKYFNLSRGYQGSLLDVIAKEQPGDRLIDRIQQRKEAAAEFYDRETDRIGGDPEVAGFWEGYAAACQDIQDLLG